VKAPSKGIEKGRLSMPHLSVDKRKNSTRGRTWAGNFKTLFTPELPKIPNF